MSKDPAFMFYSADFLSGTMLMTHEEIGEYILLICLQHQKGHLSEEEIKKITDKKNVISKFILDKNGMYFNKRLENEIKKRAKYSESRRKNRLGKQKTYDNDMNDICNSYVPHMEDEDVIENININNNNIYSFIESNFNRTLTPIEYGKISELEDNELTRYAIEIAVLNGVTNIRYVEAILDNWKKDNITSKDQVVKKRNKKPAVELFEYDWLNDEEVEC